MKDATSNARKRNTQKVLGRENLKKRDNLEDTGPIWEDNFLLDLKHMVWEYVYWIQLV